MASIVRGKVHLVGAGPGDPELLTVRAHRLIARADVVLHDDLVPAAILALAGPRTEVTNVGKRCGRKGITQAEINARMIEFARRGLEVVRLKSGDPGIFGRLAEEIDALETAGVPFEIVPGITAGIAAAASLGVSLTDRRRSSRVIIVSGHRAPKNAPEEKTDWKSLAREDATLVVYMPGNDFASLRKELLAAGLDPAIPAVIVSHATTPRQQHRSTTLGALDTLPHMESPAVLLIGRSLDRAHRRSKSDAVSLAFEEAELILSSL
ncbi:MAG TPA: uroporphyrinogen-III C-methyltransferase [Candidatus Acidoferrales bacterium]|nr:uroporphyrinogen-III C-methyltransferase [Candidatus Acidoferrales bacterium]